LHSDNTGRLIEYPAQFDLNQEIAEAQFDLNQEIAECEQEAVAIKVEIKRAYDLPSAEDGYRVLVDRLWPRGLSKDKAQIDLWMKEIAPSSELRHWFGHDPAKWHEFQKRYQAELKQHTELLSHLRQLARRGPLTLVYGAKDKEHNDAVVLREILNT